MDIELKDITKRYQRKTALEGVSVRLEAGQIHALVGENGAGKSTLASILAGLIPPTSGSIFLDGKEVHFSGCGDALEKGIVMVAQRPLLSESLSAKENIFLALSSFSSYSVTKLLLTGKIPPLLEQLRSIWCPELSLDAKVRDLGGNLRFYVSLLSSLMLKPKCLILDEPSVFLDVSQRQELYTRLNNATKEGLNCIVITHSSSEAQQNARTVTFLKNGRVSDIAGYWTDDKESSLTPLAQARKDETPSEHEAKAPSHKQSGPDFQPHSEHCLVFDHISARPKNRAVLIDASLSASYGEVTAICGMKEAALDTLEDLLTGMNSDGGRGTIHFFSREGKEYTLSLEKGEYTPRFLRSHKTAMVSSDRVYRASHPRLTITELLSVYDHTVSEKKVEKLIQEAQVNITGKDVAASLSGGMLQRLILVRELAADPDCIILCNPLQGLDIKAQKSMTEKIFSLAREGRAVIIVGAADFPLSLCHKVYTIEGGTCSLSYSGGLV